jgi:hypothetical protein
MSMPLLATRFFIPPVRTELVPRPIAGQVDFSHNDCAPCGILFVGFQANRMLLPRQVSALFSDSGLVLNRSVQTASHPASGDEANQAGYTLVQKISPGFNPGGGRKGEDLLPTDGHDRRDRCPQQGTGDRRQAFSQQSYGRTDQQAEHCPPRCARRDSENPDAGDGAGGCHRYDGQLNGIIADGRAWRVNGHEGQQEGNNPTAIDGCQHTPCDGAQDRPTGSQRVRRTQRLNLLPHL